MDYKRQIIAEYSARNKASGATAAFRRDMDRTVQSVKRLAGSIAGMVGFGAGIYGFVRLGQSMIKAASDAEETKAKFDTVFKDLAVGASKWAEDFGDSVGRATQDVQSWMAGLQDTFVPLGIAREEAAALSKSLVTLAVDVASFNNKADADVIRDFTSALVGNHETVRKYGIIISESAISQAALNRGWDKSYKELTDLEKVQLRYNLIQAGTTDAQGDAIRTADSYANQVKRLSANWTEFKTNIGSRITSPLAELLSDLNRVDQYLKDIIESEQILRNQVDFQARDRAGQSYGIRPPTASRPRIDLPPGMAHDKETGMMFDPKFPSRQYPLGTPMGTLDIPPARMQVLAEMRSRMRGREEIDPAWREAEGATRGAAEAAYGKQMAAAAELEAANAFKRTQITAQMYTDMGTFGAGYFESQRTLLDMQRADYEGFIQNKALMDEWYHTKLQQLAIDSSMFWKETGSALQSVKGSLSDVFMGMEKWPSLLESIANSFRRMAANLAAEMVMFQAMSALIGGGAATAFGFGNPLAGMKNVEFGGLFGGLFKGSRQEGGYIPETGLYQLHAGENVTRPGASPASASGVVVNMHYEGLPLEMTKQTSRRDSRGEVIDIWLKAAENDMRVRRAMGR